ncbi:hypothetical protein G6F31_020557 [Rhizopus arrhizus]|nr:hypothetical protein G6F31_020557 [Rhizopus arrhizus]
MPEHALPVVAVLATGGTIAGAQADATSAGYKAGSFSVNDLLAAPEHDARRLAHAGRARGHAVPGRLGGRHRHHPRHGYA